MDLLQSLLALMTPIGLALFALLITREGQKDRAAENARRDARDEADRAQRVKDSQQFMLLFATITGKQETGTAAVTSAVAGAKTDVTSAIEKSGADVISHVETSKDEVLVALSLLGEFNTEVFKPVSSKPPDLTSMAKILETALKAVKDVQKQQKEDANTGAGDEEGSIAA